MKYHKRINISNDLMTMANVVAEAIVNHPDTAATLEAGEQTELYIIYKDNPSSFNAINFADSASLFRKEKL